MRERSITRGDVAVIGAGVVGNAIAERFSREGRDVAEFEAGLHAGEQISGHNSQVIHSGIVNTPDSLKALLCVPGNRLLKSYARTHRINYRNTGKLVVAAESEEGKLEQLRLNADQNGVDYVQLLTAKEIVHFEPKVTSHSGLLVPSTGIIDVSSLVHTLGRQAERNGAAILTSTPLHRGEIRKDGVLLEFGDNELGLFDLVINSAGLNAQAVASSIDGIPKTLIPPTEYAKGYYYRLQAEPPFTHHVYPIPPVRGGLGIHATVGLDGSVLFGPNVEWLKTPDVITPTDIHDYSHEESPDRFAEFVTTIQKYYQDLEPGSLKVGDTGIRPKTGRTGGQDFIIQGAEELGDIGVINLYAIESPGLTSSLPLSEVVWKMAQEPGLSAYTAAHQLFRN